MCASQEKRMATRSEHGDVRTPAFEDLEPRLLLSGRTPLIAEFLAINQTGFQDGWGNRPDWIEIHNPTDSTVSLDGWELKDSSTEWPFPTGTTITPGGRLVVFADDEDTTDPAGYHHTNFKLTSGGEYLALLNADGQAVHAYDPNYPEQIADVSYGLSGWSEVTDTLVGEGSTLHVLVPGGPVDEAWKGGATFDDSAWLRGDTSVGFEATTDPAPEYDYDDYIETDVEADMFDVNATAYVRFSFLVPDPFRLSTLTLRMRYDDGFVAYLNGVEIARRNAVDPLLHDSHASASHDDPQAVLFEDIDVSAYLDEVAPGGNVLAIHGLNASEGNDDFLIAPELLADRIVLGPYQYYETPSPRDANSGGAPGIVADTKFSVDRGFYTEPFDVAITTATQGAAIWYTTDASVPEPTNPAATLYTAPLTIGQHTTLRAAAFKAGWIPANADTQTYVFPADVIQQTGDGFPDNWGWVWKASGGVAEADYAMDPEIVAAYDATIRDDMKAVPTISLVMPMDDWFGDGGQGIYLSGQGIERGCSVELIYPDGSEGFQIDAGIEIQGGTSTNRWKTDKLSMQVTFKEPWGPTKLDFPIFGSDATDWFDTFILDARLNQCWAYHGGSSPDWQREHAQYTRDQFVSTIQNLMGGYGTYSQPVHLYLNGLYWGVYIAHERPDESFAEAYLGGDKDDYDVVKHTSSTIVNNGVDPADPGDTDTARDKYLEMFAVLNNSGLTANEKYQQIQAHLDVPNFIDYMILNYYVGNMDWDQHNWYATRSRVDPDGRWRFHSWDAEHVLKGTGDNRTGYNDSDGPTGIHHRLRASAEYQMLFADHLHKHFFNDGLLTPTSAAALYQAAVDRVDRAVVGESARWGDNAYADAPYTHDEHWAAERDRLLDTYFPGRTNTVLNQLKGYSLYPDVDAPAFYVNAAEQYGGEISRGDELAIGNPNGTGTLYYTLDGSDPRLPGGDVRPDAVAYTGPIALDRTEHLKARVLDGDEWSALAQADFYIDVSGDLRITEMMYNPADPTPAEIAAGFANNDDFEFIELTNIATETIQLDQVAFTNGVQLTFPNLDLGAGEYVIAVSNQAAFEYRYDGFAGVVAGQYAGSLANGGEEIDLETPLGVEIHDFDYDDGWYDITDGDGYSLTIADPGGDLLLWDQKSGWKPSQELGGTPGAGDDGLVPGSVVIHEVLAHSDGGVEDWIELHNTCLLYTSPSPRDRTRSRMPSSA